MADLLDAITARLQNDDAVEPLAAQPEDAQGDAEEFVDIIQSLHGSLQLLNPGQEYADSLRADLLDARPGALRRLRQMPARVHVAAILALFAGCALFMLRRLFGSEPAQDVPEEAVATPL